MALGSPAIALAAKPWSSGEDSISTKLKRLRVETGAWGAIGTAVSGWSDFRTLKAGGGVT
jgi:hypothetical protein